MDIVNRRRLDIRLTQQQVDLRPVMLPMKNQMGANITKPAGIGNAFCVLINQGCIHIHIVVPNKIHPLFMCCLGFLFDVADIELFPKFVRGYVSAEHPAIPYILRIDDMR